VRDIENAQREGKKGGKKGEAERDNNFVGCSINRGARGWGDTGGEDEHAGGKRKTNSPLQ
jgi:hypothetical protein